MGGPQQRQSNQISREVIKFGVDERYQHCWFSSLNIPPSFLHLLLPTWPMKRRLMTLNNLAGVLLVQVLMKIGQFLGKMSEGFPPPFEWLTLIMCCLNHYQALMDIWIKIYWIITPKIPRQLGQQHQTGGVQNKAHMDQFWTF